MTKLYNKREVKQERQNLRNNMSRAEVILWSKLRGGQVEGVKFRRQFSIGPYIIDFYSPSIRLAIEVDGDSHFGGDAEVRDLKRQAFIESFGIHFLRFTNGDVYDNLAGVIDEVMRVVRERQAIVRGKMNDKRGDPPVSPLSKGGRRGVESLENSAVRRRVGRSKT